MNRKGKMINYFKLWMLLLIVLIAILISGYQLITLTNTRYIKTENDEIRGYYTSLHMQGTGEGNCIVLENQIGYTTFQLMNFEGEDVTKRDIEYNIQTLETYYDISGNTIAKENLASASALYVKDVWGRPQMIQKDTYKYNVSVSSSNSEKGHGAPNGATHMFSYQEVNDKGVGKTHTITLKLERTDSSKMTQVENISVVIELVKPYKEVYIVNMVVVNRLIAFTNTEALQFDVTFQRLNIQTADAFRINSTNIDAKAFKVKLTWNKANLIIDKRDLDILHNIKDGDASNLDITKPYIISLDTTSDICTLELYIPQSSSINIDFFPLLTTYELTAEVRYSSTENNYVLYDNNVGGYNITNENATILVLCNDKTNVVH